MTKRTKLSLIVLIPVLVVLIVLYTLVSAVYKPTPEPVVWPQGELTDSIFTEQNNKYIENDSLEEKHEFKAFPYTVDVPKGDGAVVGSGTIYKAEGVDNFFIFATEYDDSTNAQDIITSQFPAVMLIEYIPENTRVTVQVDKKGFINGFSAEYIAETIVASDGTNKCEAAILGYALNIPEVDYAGEHIFIGVGTTLIDTESLQTCADMLNMVVNTITKDEELFEKRQKEAERLAEEEREKAEDMISETQTAAKPQEQTAPVPKTATIPIPIDREYGNLTIRAEWDNYNPDAILELFNPEKTLYYDPSTQDGLGATFMIPNGEAGTYELHIANAEQCGAIRTSHSGAEIDKISDTPVVDGTSYGESSGLAQALSNGTEDTGAANDTGSSTGAGSTSSSSSASSSSSSGTGGGVDTSPVVTTDGTTVIQGAPPANGGTDIALNGVEQGVIQ